jgi:hypothetical protein
VRGALTASARKFSAARIAKAIKIIIATVWAIKNGGSEPVGANGWSAGKNSAFNLFRVNFLYHRNFPEHLSTKIDSGPSSISTGTLVCGGFHVHTTR